MVRNKLYRRMFREIGSNFGQFLSIVLIIAVGSMLMSGMFSAITAMDETTDSYYEEQNIADLWVYFNGITEEDYETLAQTDGVTQAAARYTISEDVLVNDVDCTIRFHSLTDINRPLVTEGSLPTTKDEIVIDSKFAEANDFVLGEQIKVKGETLTVTGFCMDPEYAYKQKDAATIVTSNRTFGIAYTDQATLIALIKTSDVYTTQVTKTEAALDDAKAQLDEGQAKLDDANSEYQTNKAEADSAFGAAGQQLEVTKDNLYAAQAELNQSITAANQQFEEAQAQLDQKMSQLEQNKSSLDESFAAYQEIRNTLFPEEQTEQDEAFQSQYDTLYQESAALEQQQSVLDEQKDNATTQATEKQNEIDAGFAAYESKLSAWDQERQDTYTRLDEAKAQLDANQAELFDQEESYLSQKSDVEEELSKAAENYQEVLFKTDDPEKVIDVAKTMDTYVSHVELSNQSSYVNVSGALDPIRSVSYVFPLIFFLVAAAIAFISLSKTVENQRTQIAVMRALGIEKSSIRRSFLLYSFLAAVFGSVPFALIGNVLIPKLLIKVFMNRFELPEAVIPVYPLYVVLPLLFAVIFCGVATLLAVQKVIREIPAQAMRPRPPKGTKTIWVERYQGLWQKLRYSHKLVLRNIFLNKGRIFLSSIGIIGSVMLVLTGLSLQSAAHGVVDTTVDSMGYDLSVVYQNDPDDDTALPPTISVEKMEWSKTAKATLNAKDDVTVNLQLVENSSDLVCVFDAKGNQITFDQNSVVIPDTIAKEYGLFVGDYINVTVNDVKYRLKVSDISMEYATKTMYMTFNSAKACGLDLSKDTLLVALKAGSSAEHTVQTLSGESDVKSVNTKEDMVSHSKDMLKTLNATILLILISAAVLAITVIYNITSINIFERTREYATLMVLGYYKEEVNHLTLVENLLTTGFGSLLGLPLGYVLFRYLAEIIGESNLRIPTGLDFKMVIATIILTFAFTFLSHLLLRPKIKNIVLTEALKSVE